MNAALLIGAQEHGGAGRRDEKGTPGDFSPHGSSPYSWHMPLRACSYSKSDKQISADRARNESGKSGGVRWRCGQSNAQKQQQSKPGKLTRNGCSTTARLLPCEMRLPY